MGTIAAVFYTISLLLGLGGVYYVLSLSKPGVYPPKYIVKRRAASLIAVSLSFTLLAIIFHRFQ